MELPDPQRGVRGLEEVEAIPSFDSSTPLQASEGHRPTEWKGLASFSLVQREQPGIAIYSLLTYVMSASLYFLSLYCLSENAGQSKPPKGAAGGFQRARTVSQYCHREAAHPVHCLCSIDTTKTFLRASDCSSVQRMVAFLQGSPGYDFPSTP